MFRSKVSHQLQWVTLLNETVVPNNDRMANGTSHDQNFKNLILDYPRDALAFFAPQEAPSPEDDVRIVPVRQEQLKARLGNRFRELDVPLMVEWHDGRREALLFAIEEETVQRRFSPHRLAHYCLDLAELLGTDRVVPVVIFLRGDNSPGGLTLGSERRQYLGFDYLSCVLPQMPAGDWAHSNNLVARLNLPNMQWPLEAKLTIYAQAIRGLFTLEPDADKRTKYIDFVDIYAALTDNELRRYQQEFPKENAQMVTLSQRLREEGREEGRTEGIVEGERIVVRRLLEKRFGVLPASMLEDIDRSTAEQLQQWTDRILFARSLSEVFDS